MLLGKKFLVVAIQRTERNVVAFYYLSFFFCL